MIKKYLILLLSFLGLISCIQGPWSYSTDSDPEIFVGVTSYAYVIADRPLSDVCFERMLSLNEVVSNNRAFYKTASVTVQGEFEGVESTVVLSPKSGEPNCFVGDETMLASRGKSYKLAAEFTWDSLGVEVTSRLNSTANVPTKFTLIDSVRVTPEAITPSGVNFDNPIAVIENLPLAAQLELFEEWGGRLPTDQSDTVAFIAFYQENGADLSESISVIMGKEEYQSYYKKGDQVYYLGGELNTVSHTFSSQFSEDVGGVLITHTFQDSAKMPYNRFDEIALRFKGELDPRNVYFEGGIRRLISYEKLDLPNGKSIFENLGVTNTWFFEGTNKLYFYGVEPAYIKFLNTYVLSGDDPKVIPQFNIEGGEGYFIGAVLDSFDMEVKLLPGHRYFSYFEARADRCFERDWKLSDCREFIGDYCKGVGYDEINFERDSISLLQGDKNYFGGFCNRIAVEKDLDSNLALGSTFKDYSKSKDNLVVAGGTWRHCIKNDFKGDLCTKSLEQCSIYRPGENLEESEEGGGPGEEKKAIEAPTCQTDWWGYCEDNNWQGESCQMASVNWCKQEGKILDEVLCAEAKNYCTQNPSFSACLN